MERQYRAGGRVFVIEESKHCALGDYFQPKLLPLPQDKPTDTFGRMYEMVTQYAARLVYEKENMGIGII